MSTKKLNRQVVVIGGGPAGTSCALSLQALGMEPTIIEQEQFPRFHIGESMTGECGAAVRALGVEKELAEMCKPVVKWGASIYGAGGKNSFYVPVMGRDADGELFDQSTWQVRRSTFDKMLLDTTRSRGIEVLDARAKAILREDDNSASGVQVQTDRGIIDIGCDYLVDASGQSTFFANQGLTSEKLRGNYSKQVAIFSHFEGCVRDAGKLAGDTLLFYRERHHWAWFIPIDDEVTSVGIVTPSDYFKSQNKSKKEFLLDEMTLLNPELTWRMENVRMIEEARACSNYSYHIKNFTGKNYLCVGDSHRFIDPIFSLGLHFSMAEGRKAAMAIRSAYNGEFPVGSSENQPFRNYELECDKGQDIIQEMLDAFWDYPLAFSLYIKDKRYRPNFIDMFAGRVYTTEAGPGLQAFRKLNREGEYAAVS